MSDMLEVETRDSFGKSNNRRLRRSGHLPAVLYGHGKKPVSLTVPTEQLSFSLRHGAKVVKLKGAAKCQALLQDVQWDTFQQHVLHVDFLRVEAKDRIKIEVPLVVRGEAPGQHEGGVVELLMRNIEIETSPANIPEQLQVNVNQLHIGDSMKAADVEGLPEGASILCELSATVVQCVQPTVIEEEEATVEAVEPEVIGQKDDDQEGEAAS